MKFLSQEHSKAHETNFKSSSSHPIQLATSLDLVAEHTLRAIACDGGLQQENDQGHANTHAGQCTQISGGNEQEAMGC